MSIDEFLEQAREVLITKGWIQHSCVDDTGRVCLIQALWDVGEGTWMEPYEYLQQRLGEVPIIWNDAPGRTVDEVIAMLREEAENWRTRNITPALAE